MTTFRLQFGIASRTLAGRSVGWSVLVEKRGRASLLYPSFRSDWNEKRRWIRDGTQRQQPEGPGIDINTWPTRCAKGTLLVRAERLRRRPVLTNGCTRKKCSLGDFTWKGRATVAAFVLFFCGPIAVRCSRAETSLLSGALTTDGWAIKHGIAFFHRFGMFWIRIAAFKNENKKFKAIESIAVHFCANLMLGWS